MRKWINLFEGEHPWEKLVWQVRCAYEPNFQGNCEAAAIDLAELLEAHGIPCRIIQGSYDCPYDDGEVQCDFSSHAWVEIDGYILDPTVEQFDSDETIAPVGSDAWQRYDGTSLLSESAKLDQLYAEMKGQSEGQLVNRITDIEKITTPFWCAHFSYDAKDIARHGFTKGSPLNVNWNSTSGIDHAAVGYNFAVELNDENALNFWASHSHEAVIFRATGVRSFHYDDFHQITFWHEDVIRPIYSIECVADQFVRAEDEDYRITTINGIAPPEEIVMPFYDLLAFIEKS